MVAEYIYRCILSVTSHSYYDATWSHRKLPFHSSGGDVITARSACPSLFPDELIAKTLNPLLQIVVQIIVRTLLTHCPLMSLNSRYNRQLNVHAG